jgi:hypothetical protein
MFMLVKDYGDLIKFILSANEEDSEWSIEYAAPGFFFNTKDTLLESAVAHYLETV